MERPSSSSAIPRRLIAFGNLSNRPAPGTKSRLGSRPAVGGGIGFLASHKRKSTESQIVEASQDPTCDLFMRCNRDEAHRHTPNPLVHTSCWKRRRYTSNQANTPCMIALGDYGRLCLCFPCAACAAWGWGTGRRSRYGDPVVD